MNWTKQERLIIPLEVGGGSYRVIRHANAMNSDIVRSIAGVGLVSITGDFNPQYGDIIDLQIGFDMNTSGLTKCYTKQDITSQASTVIILRMSQRVDFTTHSNNRHRLSLVLVVMIISGFMF